MINERFRDGGFRRPFRRRDISPAHVNELWASGGSSARRPKSQQEPQNAPGPDDPSSRPIIELSVLFRLEAGWATPQGLERSNRQRYW
jgi:hypothetical protein